MTVNCSLESGNDVLGVTHPKMFLLYWTLIDGIGVVLLKWAVVKWIIVSISCEATINRNDLACYVSSDWQTKKSHQAGYFIRFSNPSQRRSFQHGGFVSLIFQHLLSEWLLGIHLVSFSQTQRRSTVSSTHRIDVPWCHTIDSNSVWTPLACPVACHLIHCSLCSCVWCP